MTKTILKEIFLFHICSTPFEGMEPHRALKALVVPRILCVPSPPGSRMRDVTAAGPSCAYVKKTWNHGAVSPFPNRITLIDFLGQDSETRSTLNGTTYTRFSLATRTHLINS